MYRRLLTTISMHTNYILIYYKYLKKSSSIKSKGGRNALHYWYNTKLCNIIL